MNCGWIHYTGVLSIEKILEENTDKKRVRQPRYGGMQL